MSLTKLTQALPANQAIVSLNVSGWFFLCTAARGVFQISFDEGQSFSDWEKGLSREKESRPFKKLIFRTASSNAAANTVKFYYGTEPVKDSRLNVIDDSVLATIFTKSAAFTIVPILTGNGIPETITASIPVLSGALSLRSVCWGFGSVAGGYIFLVGSGRICLTGHGEIFTDAIAHQILSKTADGTTVDTSTTLIGGVWATYWNA